MRKLIAASLFAAISMFGQNVSTHGQTSPRLPASKRKPAIYDSQGLQILPHIVDRAPWTSDIIVTNLGKGSEPFEIDFNDDNGAPLQFNFVGVGATAALSGTLVPGQSKVYTTTGQTNADGWGSTNQQNSGQDISVYQVLRNTVPLYNNYVSEASFASTFGVDGTDTQPGANMTFDNTSGHASSIAFTNADLAHEYSSDTLNVTVFDSNGTQIGSHAVPVADGQKIAFVLYDQWPETANIAGSLFFYPADGTFSPITPVGFRFLILAQSQSFINLPILQLNY